MIDFSGLRPMLPQHVCDQIMDVALKYRIDTPLRLAHFLSQCHHESMGFKATEENLNYSVDALLRVFKKYFTPRNVEPYARNPIAIASKVYANRMGNGDEASKEGWKYRGRGYIQLTGKNNYAAFDKTVIDNLLVNPELVATKYPMLSAAWFWNERGINAQADTVSVRAVTLKVNGGLNGLDDREKLFDRYYGVLKNG